MIRLFRLASVLMVAALALIVIGGVSRAIGEQHSLHRIAGLFTALIALMAFALAIGAQVTPGVRSRVRALSLLAVGVVLVQAACGASIVDEHDHPAASAAALSLAMALFVVGFSVARLLSLDRARVIATPRSDLAADRVFAMIAGVAFVAVSGVIVSGGAARVALPSVACNAWSACQAQSLLPATPSDSVSLTFVHRISALVATASIVALVAYARRHQIERSAAIGAEIALGTIVLQVVIGALYVVSGNARPVSSLHLVLAAVSLISLVYALLMALRSMFEFGPDLAFAGVTRSSGNRSSSFPGMPMFKMAVNAGDDAIAATMPAAPVATAADAVEAPSISLVREYIQLMKPGILTLLLVTEVCAMFAAQEGVPAFSLLLTMIIGGTLVAGGANVLNCYIDRDIDKQMHRTKKRGTATGRIPANNALAFGVMLTVGSTLLIGFGANWLAAALALAGNAFYVGIYTWYLKRRTPNNIVIGGAAGAFPPLVGWAAVTGHLSVASFIMFAIIYYWTPPHFWSLALLKQGEYGRASVPMLPNVAGEGETQRQIFLYTLLLAAVSLLLAPFGFSWIYLFSALFLSGIFIAFAAMLLTRPTKAMARQTFFWSMWYLFLLFGAMVADRLVLS